MFEISAKKGLCYVICGSEVKTSDLAAHFHTILALQIRFCFTIQTFNEHSRMAKIKSTVFTRPHAMKRHKFTSPIGTNWDL